MVTRGAEATTAMAYSVSMSLSLRSRIDWPSRNWRRRRIQLRLRGRALADPCEEGNKAGQQEAGGHRRWRSLASSQHDDMMTATTSAIVKNQRMYALPEKLWS